MFFSFLVQQTVDLLGILLGIFRVFGSATAGCPDQLLRDLPWCGWVGLEKTPLSTSGNRGGLTSDLKRLETFLRSTVLMCGFRLLIGAFPLWDSCGTLVHTCSPTRIR